MQNRSQTERDMENKYLSDLTNIDSRRVSCCRALYNCKNNRALVSETEIAILDTLMFLLNSMREHRRMEYIAECERLEERRAAL